MTPDDGEPESKCDLRIVLVEGESASWHCSVVRFDAKYRRDGDEPDPSDYKELARCGISHRNAFGPAVNRCANRLLRRYLRIAESKP